MEVKASTNRKKYEYTAVEQTHRDKEVSLVALKKATLYMCAWNNTLQGNCIIRVRSYHSSEVVLKVPQVCTVFSLSTTIPLDPQSSWATAVVFRIESDSVGSYCMATPNTAELRAVDIVKARVVSRFDWYVACSEMKKRSTKIEVLQNYHFLSF